MRPARTFAGQASGTPPAPVHLTSEQDYQRLMALLHISELRRGPDGDPKSPNAANVDESKVPPYSLPDPLVLKNGKKVTTAKMWWKQRRPEIVEDFDREIYGRMPAKTPTVQWEVLSTTSEKSGEVAVVTKKLVGHVDNSSYPPITVDIQLMLTTPANAAGPVPVIMEFGLSAEVLAGNSQTLHRRPMGQSHRHRANLAATVLAKGWGYAVTHSHSMQADNGAGLTQGIIGLVNKGQPRKLDDWGALRAWAWGASRALDYFETDKSVDAKQSGHRRPFALRQGRIWWPWLTIRASRSASSVRRVRAARRCTAATSASRSRTSPSTSEYHWMAGNFLKYAGPLTPNDLPVDSHELIALCAPRPVFISSGVAASGRRLGRREGHVPRRRRRGAGVQAARQEGSRHDRIPADGDAADRRRHRFPPAHRWSHARSELADVPDFRQPLSTSSCA